MVNALYSSFGIIELFIFCHSCIYVHLKILVYLLMSQKHILVQAH